MSTAKDCFADNLNLIGSPVNAPREVMIGWNLNNGLRMLAEQVDKLEMENSDLRQQLVQLQHVLVRTSQSR